MNIPIIPNLYMYTTCEETPTQITVTTITDDQTYMFPHKRRGEKKPIINIASSTSRNDACTILVTQVLKTTLTIDLVLIYQIDVVQLFTGTLLGVWISYNITTG